MTQSSSSTASPLPRRLVAFAAAGTAAAILAAALLFKKKSKKKKTSSTNNDVDMESAKVEHASFTTSDKIDSVKAKDTTEVVEAIVEPTPSSKPLSTSVSSKVVEEVSVTAMEPVLSKVEQVHKVDAVEDASKIESGASSILTADKVDGFEPSATVGLPSLTVDGVAKPENMGSGVSSRSTAERVEAVQQVVCGGSTKPTAETVDKLDTVVEVKVINGQRDSGLGTVEDEVKDDNRVASPSSSASSSRGQVRKPRSDSGCSYGTADEVAVKTNSNLVNGGTTTSSDSANGSTETDDGMTYAYHMMVPGHLCGALIGTRGMTVKQLRSATKCAIILLTPPKGTKKCNKEPQSCIIQGTRSGIERCLVLLRDMFPLDKCPEFTMEQVNLPSPDNAYRSYEQPSQISVCQLDNGQPTKVIVSAIVSGGQVFVQLPSQPTFAALKRLEACMRNVYERLKAAVPQVPKEVINQGLVCVTMSDNKWYRVQVVECETSDDSCMVKYLDYGGYSIVSNSDLWQIRSDFLALPFQAVECYLSNVIPPNGTEWPFESGVHLEELVRNQACTANVVGYSETNVPFVQLYASFSNDDKVEGRLVNKELVERGAALWIEHTAEEISS